MTIIRNPNHNLKYLEIKVQQDIVSIIFIFIIIVQFF